MINILHGLGVRLLNLGFHTPFMVNELLLRIFLPCVQGCTVYIKYDLI